MLKRHLLAVASVVLASQALAPAAMAQDNNPAVVIQWNQLAQSTIPASAGPLAPRYYAILHIAMFDAANSIERQYTPFHSSVAASSGASAEAAVAQAAHDVLTALIPSSQPTYDAALAAKLATLVPGLAWQGVAVGKAAAARTLQWRANDGIFGPAVPFSLPLIPGLWQPAPGVPPGLTQLQNATPFTFTSITQYLVPRHPELNSARYAQDFEEVKTMGAVGSVTRNATQTQTARLFAGVITSTTINMMWNNVIRDVTLSQHLTLLDSARLYAFVNALQMDSLMNTQTGKFRFGLWRPITAIRRADEDLNPATTADPGWSPLVNTPPYPSYPGNMAGLGACAAKALEMGFGTDDIGYSVTWVGSGGNPDVTRQYASFSQLGQEEADSRIYAGLHYRFDNEASQQACVKIVQHAYATLMRPL